MNKRKTNPDAKNDQVNQENVLSASEDTSNDLYLESTEEPDMSELNDIENEDDESDDISNIINEYDANFSSLDPVNIYLKDIGKIPLLSADEEQVFGKQIFEYIEANKRIEELLAKPRLTKADNKEIDKLNEIVKIGEHAKHELSQANLRLVVSIAKRYVGRGLAFLDLIQEGNLGLMTATEKFNYLKGYKFSTYATWWIRQAITRSIAEKARVIRLPVHVVDDINKMVKARRSIILEKNRDATEEELAEALNVPLSKIKELIRCEQEPASLNITVGEDDDSTIEDFVADKNSLSPEEDALQRDRHDVIFKTFAAAKLSPKEIDIICRRFGIDRDSHQTLEEIGEDYNVTRERIRQIEAKVIKKLRHPKYSKILRELIQQ